ncbi:MAG: molybdopterin synthase small subunit [Methanoregula sp. PtaU1.Bin051]|nr:MAG: molybdopterin synthase small subunit [Methanoregula sp. PtaU1.Bin051]
MTVRIRFFARFRELLGAESMAGFKDGTNIADLVRSVTEKNREGYNAIFDESGNFREFVILMQNGKRVDVSDAGRTGISDGDEIAVFPPVAGG